MTNLLKTAMKPDVHELLKEFQHLPRFPDGRINYTGAPRAPILIVFLKYENEILLLKRSDKVYAYKNILGGIAGFIDQEKDLSEKAKEEIEEETGIDRTIITEEQWAEPYIYEQWIRCPVLFTLREKPKTIQLVFEHSEYMWITAEETRKYETVPGFWESMQKVGLV